jgi:hypothetical protein
MTRAGSWKLKYMLVHVLPKRPPQLSGTVSPAPPVFLNRYRSFLFSCVLETRNLGKWKLRALYRYCMYARFPHAKGPCNVARPPATSWPERASLQRAPRAARHRVGARSHPRRTG